MRQVRMLLIALVVTGALLSVSIGDASAQGTGTNAAFCQARLDAGTAVNRLFNGDKTAQADVDAAVLRVQQNAPAAVQADVATLANAFKAKGVMKAFDDPTIRAAGQRVDGYVAANCGYTVVKVTATDYQFTGLPKTVKAGPVVFQLTNNAPKEHHEMVVVRRLPGVNDPPAKLFALSDKQLAKKLDFANVNAVNELKPGDTGFAIAANLAPGKYIVADFLPQNGKKNGKPHFKLGMVGKFVIS